MPLARNRRAFFGSLGLACVSSALLPQLAWASPSDTPAASISLDTLRDAARVAGLDFTDEQLAKMVEAVTRNVAAFAPLRPARLANSDAPAFRFDPLLPGMPVDRARRPPRVSRVGAVARPGSLEDVAFWPLTHLAELLRTRQVTSVALTEMYLSRIERYGPRLVCVVTLTKDLALSQARDADAEIAAGRYRSPLHGVPWGVKDLFSAKGYPTTWGAAPFRTRVIDENATVVTRLESAGAVLVAKLATGELALDDVWFGGQTKNPWDLSMGSQGSSAGPASATAAGLVGFAIGTETFGSIVEPSGICGVTGLRPTFGRVSRHGAMALAWSLDKAGPMCRTVEDCALVLAAIQGSDGRDLAVQDVPFNWDASLDVKALRVGYVKAAFDDTRQTPATEANDRAALDVLRGLGLTLVEVTLPPERLTQIGPILSSEGNAALWDPIRVRPEGLARQDRVVRQNASCFSTATDYIEACRLRMRLMHEMARVMEQVDVYVVPFDYGDYTPNPVATLNTAITNLTGQPCVVVPHGFNEKGQPTSLTFVGRVFGEAAMLALALAYERATPWHTKHPRLD